jgi:hypothetical protein
MENQDYVSLYDFLGKPAGGELGKDVHAAACYSNIPTGYREVQNTKYVGKVNLYPELFLKGYFSSRKQMENRNTKSDIPQNIDDLPF